MRLIFEKSAPGRQSRLADPPVLACPPLPAELQRETPPALPEVSELEVTRHFTGLSRRNFGVDSHFYPLGSCTMKFNPRINEAAAS
ncbi:MAG TPA: aminomethyl-transferring glycine dehydrogenase subunit GcvPB, partial [Candidatus Hydrogenedentes bacterium]|nr:aminomethyl-transferring glycine dehydrogenase subunit GcvPB [Candidatus Hydrogenedentota bacterium]